MRTSSEKQNIDSSFSEKSSWTVAVLGGGISGLSAAFYLRQKFPQIQIHVIEKRSRTGGVLETVHREGFQIERSADNFITDVPWGVNLCRELGLIEELAQTDNRYRKTGIVHRGKLAPLPDGFMMMAPTKLWPFVFSPLLGPRGKLRAGLELFLPRGHFDDETMAHFVIRRLGQETFDHIVEPMLGGIYAGDATRLSVRATLPRFLQMEKEHRSLILAMRHRQKLGRQIVREEQSGARYSFFVTLKRGLSCLIETLEKRLRTEGVSFDLNREIESVRQEPTASGNAASWKIIDTNGRTLLADAVILALPSQETSRVLSLDFPEIARDMGLVEHTGTAVVTMAFRNEQIQKPIHEMGFVVPKLEKSPLVAGSFSSYKYPHRAPAGTTLLRFFTGGARMPELVEFPDEQLTELVYQEAQKLLDLKGRPILTDLARWPDTMPQYYVGHLEMLTHLDHELEKYPTLALAGNALRGVGIPACIKSGIEAAEKISLACHNKK